MVDRHLSVVGRRPETDPLDERSSMARIHEALFGEGLDPVRLGRYRILNRLGTGGFATVYAAFDPKLDRKVALKVFAGRATNGGGVEDGVLAEAQALARVNHPNVVHVYDAGVVDAADGESVFISMEFVDGESLDAWARRVRPGWRKLVEVYRAAARGLAAAHAVGLVHHDIKPGNLILGADGRVRVIDFGLARASGRDGVAAGTPGYMSPEQHAGGHTDARSDVFSFAVALWEVLYDAAPFEGTSMEDLAASKRSGPLEASGRRGPAWHRTALRRGLCADPADRPRDMSVMLTALAPPRAPRVLGALVAVGLAVAAGAWAVHSPLPTRVVASHGAVVDELTREVRAAAARAIYVYPPPEDPGRRSAFARVLELEGLDGAGAEPGRIRGRQLRRELADTLVRLGDRYWDREGGRLFAADYYVLALLFDPDDARARARAPITAGALGHLRKQAASGAFSAGELIAATPLAALAKPSPARGRAVRALIEDGALGSRAVAALAELEPESIAPHRFGGPVRGSDSIERWSALERADPGAPNEGAESAAAGATPGVLAEAATDRGAAKRATRRGTAAAEQGRWSDAIASFNQALEDAPRYLPAMMGLYRVRFARGEYARALKLARLITTRAPRRAAGWLARGDAAYKTMDYAQARASYERARGLGEGKAAKRLEKLDGG